MNRKVWNSIRQFQVFCLVLSFAITCANLHTLIRFHFVMRGFLIAAIVASALPVIVALILDTGGERNV